MKAKVLVVVDLQNDFITGVLGSKAVQSIIPKVKEKIENFDGEVIFTMDTHYDNYLDTQEGKNIPFKHCIKGTEGWEICSDLKPYAKMCVTKNTFGAAALPDIIQNNIDEVIEEIEVCGLCTDICVVSNVMMLKSVFPEARIIVDASCCAGTTEKNHKAALYTMSLVQVDIINND